MQILDQSESSMQMTSVTWPDRFRRLTCGLRSAEQSPSTQPRCRVNHFKPGRRKKCLRRTNRSASFRRICTAVLRGKSDHGRAVFVWTITRLIYSTRVMLNRTKLLRARVNVVQKSKNYKKRWRETCVLARA